MNLNKRDYLRKQGFKVGERGRFTPAMLTALENSGLDFEENIDKPLVYEVELVTDTVVFHEPVMPVMREPRTLYGLNREGTKISFVLCFKCNHHMMYCSCEKIQAPPSVIFSQEKDVHVGR